MTATSTSTAATYDAAVLAGVRPGAVLVDTRPGPPRRVTIIRADGDQTRGVGDGCLLGWTNAELAALVARGTYRVQRAPTLHPTIRGAITDLLVAGNKIRAIGLYRRATACSVREAKIAVEDMDRTLWPVCTDSLHCEGAWRLDRPQPACLPTREAFAAEVATAGAALAAPSLDQIGDAAYRVTLVVTIHPDRVRDGRNDADWCGDFAAECVREALRGEAVVCIASERA